VVGVSEHDMHGTHALPACMLIQLDTIEPLCSHSISLLSDINISARNNEVVISHTHTHCVDWKPLRHQHKCAQQ
jgi:hypothetical protein